MLSLKLEGRRKYGQAAEQRVYEPPKDIEFVESFPRRSKEGDDDVVAVISNTTPEILGENGEECAELSREDHKAGLSPTPQFLPAKAQKPAEEKPKPGKKKKARGARGKGGRGRQPKLLIEEVSRTQVESEENPVLDTDYVQGYRLQSVGAPKESDRLKHSQTSDTKPILVEEHQEPLRELNSSFPRPSMSKEPEAITPRNPEFEVEQKVSTAPAETVNWRPQFSILTSSLQKDSESIPLKGSELEHNTEVKTWRWYELALSYEPDMEEEPIDETIHMLGLGAVGKYVAHSLARLPHAPPVTLLMHRPLLMQQWYDEGSAITLLKDGKIDVQSNFKIECSADFQSAGAFDEEYRRFSNPLSPTSRHEPNTTIENLIITTDPSTTIGALSKVQHRLRSSSTIFFISDGLGIIEKVNETIFPDPSRRPTYVIGNTSHKLASTERPFTIIEKAAGSIYCTKLPQVSVQVMEQSNAGIRRKDFSWTPQTKHLVRTLLRTPELGTNTLGHKSFYEVQLRKLAVAAVIEPLSVALDCSNDQLLFNYAISRTIRPLLKEISQIIRALPDITESSKVDDTFSPERLEVIVVSSIKGSRKNLSTMLQSVRAGKRPDIDFYTGYLVRKAHELGIDCPRNEMLLHLVRGKYAIRSREENSYIPYERED